YVGDFDEIITDCADIYEELKNYAEEEKRLSGLKLPTVRFYQDAYPLEKLYSVKTLLEGALNSRVWLKSGGYLVIEPTEALTVIDVNTGKYEAGKHSEDTFYAINMEAAEEIALQLRLRNLSGIIIVDFINMASEEKQKELLHRLTTLVKADSVKTSVVDMTPLGLVEITRKRINRPLSELFSQQTSSKHFTEV
ncbi:MAG: ribonuclease E/G, partial [Lachnospiraceae bacterium]